MKNAPASSDLSAQIAQAIRDAIVSGRLVIDERLPSEADLSSTFDVSRSTIREALKRLAAQNLIRTQRGASGGAFVNRLTFAQASAQQVTISTLLLSMNDVSFETACEARYALERACIPLAVERREARHIDKMRREIARQAREGLSDEDFCASDVAFHRALVDAAGNPVLSYQLTGAVEAMQPLMNMITFTKRSRSKIVSLHISLARAIETGDGAQATADLVSLQHYATALGRDIVARRG